MPLAFLLKKFDFLQQNHSLSPLAVLISHTATHYKCAFCAKQPEIRTRLEQAQSKRARLKT
jgi:hypothetical protein